MTPPADPGRWLALLHALADRADAIALDRFQARDLRVEIKADRSPVSEADRAIEEAARAFVRERYPGLGVCGEEYGEVAGSDDARLIIDPIDGTRNFVRGIPVFATLLAIEEAGEVTSGVVSAPALGARWHAARGAGAFSGTRALRVSRIADLAGADLFHGDLGGTAEPGPPESMARLLARVHRTRGFGDFYQHVLVAAGAGEIALGMTVKPWDVAPLQVLVEEAGGRATTLSGERTIAGGSFLSTNGLVHDQVLALLETREERP